MHPVVRHLDLFSGIGGFALACRMVGGIETVAFCEREPYCQRVLAKHWPDVPICNDIHDLKGTEYGTIELITGGYPCQPFSLAGKRKGAGDDRHLWPEMRRIVETARPSWVLCENVVGHVTLGLDEVLSDLDSIGYASWAAVIPACAVDAQHRRDRVWIVAYSECPERRENYDGRGCLEQGENGEGEAAGWSGKCRSILANASNSGDVRRHGELGAAEEKNDNRGGEDDGGREWWPVEPDVGRVAHGIPARVDRLRGLGNAIVPQVAAEIIRAMMQADRQANAQADRPAKAGER